MSRKQTREAKDSKDYVLGIDFHSYDENVHHTLSIMRLIVGHYSVCDVYVQHINLYRTSWS